MRDIKEILKQKVDKLAEVYYDPYDLNNFKKVCDRLRYHIENKHRIHIHGDYDVDGVTSTTIMNLLLRSKEAPYTWVVPSRKVDGYGFKTKHAERVNADLLILVDNGTTSVEAVNMVLDKGIDVIIIDHHRPKDELPATEYIINPWLPDDKTSFKDLCAASLTYFVVQDILEDVDLLHYCKALAGLGTIADTMPLININRDLASFAYDYLNLTTGYGIDFIPKGGDLQYSTVPILNAPGRMSDPILSVYLLMETDMSKAETIAYKIMSINDYRKKRTHEILSELSPHTESSIYIVKNDNIEEGLIGIVAGQMLEITGKPAVVISGTKGSARSPNQIDIFEILKQFGPLLTDFGGHTQACGFSVTEQNREELVKGLRSVQLPPIHREISYDAVISLSDINFALYRLIQSLKPFGYGNKEPVFKTEKILIRNARIVGSNQNVLRMNLPNGLVAVKFNETKLPSDVVDLIYTIQRNEWNNTVSLQLKVIEVINYD